MQFFIFDNLDCNRDGIKIKNFYFRNSYDQTATLLAVNSLILEGNDAQTPARTFLLMAIFFNKFKKIRKISQGKI